MSFWDGLFFRRHVNFQESIFFFASFWCETFHDSWMFSFKGDWCTHFGLNNLVWRLGSNEVFIGVFGYVESPLSILCHEGFVVNFEPLRFG